jgi:hypothetical protein
VRRVYVVVELRAVEAKKPSVVKIYEIECSFLGNQQQNIREQESALRIVKKKDGTPNLIMLSMPIPY